MVVEIIYISAKHAQINQSYSWESPVVLYEFFYEYYDITISFFKCT